jgi:hypothetical protein
MKVFVYMFFSYVLRPFGKSPRNGGMVKSVQCIAQSLSKQPELNHSDIRDMWVQISSIPESYLVGFVLFCFVLWWLERNPVHTRQVLYHWATPPVPIPASQNFRVRKKLSSIVPRKGILSTFLFGSTGIWTHSLTLARQTLYHLSHIPSPFFACYFSDSCVFLPRVGLRLCSSSLCVPWRWDHRNLFVEMGILLTFFFFLFWLASNRNPPDLSLMNKLGLQAWATTPILFSIFSTLESRFTKLYLINEMCVPWTSPFRLDHPQWPCKVWSWVGDPGFLSTMQIQRLSEALSTWADQPSVTRALSFSFFFLHLFIYSYVHTLFAH